MSYGMYLIISILFSKMVWKMVLKGSTVELWALVRIQVVFFENENRCETTKFMYDVQRIGSILKNFLFLWERMRFEKW
jgi:hypothetical protein